MNVECYVRAGAHNESINHILDSLQEYAQEGTIDNLSITVWPSDTRLVECTENTPVRNCYSEFQEWSERNGVSLQPAFTHKERSSLINGSSETVLCVPTLCVAVYIDGELVNIAPHTRQSNAYTVEDILSFIEEFALEPSSENTSQSVPEQTVRTDQTIQSTDKQPSERREGETTK